MIQSATNSLIQSGFGFDGVAGSGARASKRVDSSSGSNSPDKPSGSASGSDRQLTAEEQQLVQQLKQTDRKVRAHEQAHISVGADLIRGGPTYSYQTGPDNKRYAVGGEVSIDTSPGRTPEETIPKAQHIRATALAPADPSPQDHSVAAQASRMEGDARTELAIQQREGAAGEEDQGSSLFYRSVEQSDASNSRVGSYLDLFA